MSYETLVIKGSEWRRGGDRDLTKNGYLPQGETFLLNGQGLRCCVGILGRARGVPDADMLANAVPGHIVKGNSDPSDTGRQFAADWLQWQEEWEEEWEDKNRPPETDPARAFSQNDNKRLSDAAIIASLEPIFNRIGYTLDWRPNE